MDGMSGVSSSMGLGVGVDCKSSMQNSAYKVYVSYLYRNKSMIHSKYPWLTLHCNNPVHTQLTLHSNNLEVSCAYMVVAKQMLTCMQQNYLCC